MKKQLFYVFIGLNLVLACSKKEVSPTPIPAGGSKPEVAFTFITNSDGLATFTNNTKNAETYEWDFGDGSAKSTQKSPEHQYLKPAKFKVVLTATSKEGSTTLEKESEIKIIQNEMTDIDILISDFIKKYNLPGASLAIAKNEKLVYSKGFGFANIATNEKMTPANQLRIASCSKAYCGMAIMKLVEQKKLNITDKVFGDGAILGKKFGTKVYSDKVKSLTVEQLLHNTTGFFCQSKGDDFINRQANLNDSQFLSWAMDNSIFEFDPGTAYHYNNTNFFVASMVVEQLSGMAYGAFLKKEIFDVIGDKDGLLANTKQAHPKEVKYYGQGALVGQEYFDVERYKGAGSTVTTSVGMLKFALSLDGKTTRKDLLSEELMKEFSTTTSFVNTWGLGLGVWGNRRYMYGSFPGTRSAWMFDTTTGLSASLIFNGNLDYTKGSAYYDPFAFAVQDLMVNLITKNRNYQNIDQFVWE
jgi:D-alanyl-D-alanine carboxypeptidase